MSEAARLVVENRELRAEVAYRVETGDSRADHIVELLAENRSLQRDLDGVHAEDRRYDISFDAARDQYAEDRRR